MLGYAATREPCQLCHLRIWEGLRRLLAEIKGRRLLEELTDKHATGWGVEEAPLQEKRLYPGWGVEKLRGVESKFNEQDPFTGATQFRLLFLQDLPRIHTNLLWSRIHLS
jgi:hypothetical protein